MKTLLRVLIAIMSSAILIFQLSGCCEDEPVIIVPAPEPAAPVVTGTVTTNGGEALKDALVTITGNGTYTVATDEYGKYSIEISEGSFSISVSKDGYSVSEGTITAENDAVTVWNALLSVPIMTSGDITAAEDTYIEVPVPPLVEESTTVTEVMTATIPAESTEEDDELIMEFNYDASIVSDTKSTSLMRLVNVNYYLSSGKQLKKPILITVPIPAETYRVLLNQESVEYEFDSQKSEIRISTQTLGRITMDYFVDISEGLPETVDVSFTRSVYDNFYGSSQMHVLNPEYSYYTGGYLTGNHVLLNSLAAVYSGIPAKTKVSAEYCMNLILPVGGKLVLNGSQTLRTTEFDVADGLMHTTVVEYLGPVISAETYNRQHMGGSN